MTVSEIRNTIATFDRAAAVEACLAGATTPIEQVEALSIESGWAWLSALQEIWPAVASRCAEHLEGITHSLLSSSVPPFASLLAEKEEAYRMQSARPGRVNALYVSGARGAVHPLHIQSTPWVTGAPRLQLALDDAAATDVFRRAVNKGTLAAERWLLDKRENPSPADYLLLRAHLREATFPTVPPKADLDGESIGLGVAVASVSSLLKLRVPAGLGFSGAVEENGRVSAVAGLSEKCAAAASVGLTRVFVPRGSQVTAVEGIDIVTVGSLSEALDQMGWDDLSVELTALFGTSRPADYADVNLDELLKHQDSGSRIVMFSAVGTSDPVGRLKDTRGDSFASADGPILSMCRVVRPHIVQLLYTEGRSDPKEDMSGNAARTRDSLSSEGTAGEVRLTTLGQVNPTDYAGVFKGFADAVDAAELKSTDIILLNGTSGTPVMVACWVLVYVKLFGVYDPDHVAVLQSVEARFGARGHVVRNATNAIQQVLNTFLPKRNR